MALSITENEMSAAFFLLVMVDGFHVLFAYTSLTFLPCWIVPLVENILKEIVLLPSRLVRFIPLSGRYL